MSYTDVDFTFEPGGYADNATPLIKNCWYVAGFSSEISRDVISRRFLGTEVALYRTLAGEPVAVRNRCPHRSFPLAKGRLEGDVLVCGYHGMQFDPSGRCVNMPSMPIVPANANVRSFPVAERGPIVWIWMGNPDLADESKIPDTSWLADPTWKSVCGTFPLNTDYVAMHENLLDQTHFPFLHPGTVGTLEYARSKLKVRQEGDVVIIDRSLKNSPPPGIYGIPTNLMHKNVDRLSEARFASPAIHTAFAQIIDHEPAQGRPSTYRFNITHLVTPESNGRIHYWWFNSRNFDLDNAETDKFLYEASTKAYLEDVDALEAILNVVQTDVEPQFDLNFAPDKPGLMMRKVLHQLASAEANYQYALGANPFITELIMAKIIGCIGTSHVPTIGVAYDKGRQNDPAWAPLFEGYKPVAAWLAEKKPDALVFIYNDHATTFFFDMYPTFAIGVGERFPVADEGAGLRNLPPIKGNVDLQCHIAESLVNDEFDMTIFQEKPIDHGCASPLPLLWPHDPDWPGAIVPIAVNVLQYPLPTARRCYKLGQAIRRAVESYPEDLKVVIVGTGGLSHQIHGERTGFNNEEWDMEFLRQLQFEPEKLTKLTHADFVRLGGAESVEQIMWLAMRGAMPEKIRKLHQNYYLATTTAMTVVLFEEGEEAAPQTAQPTTASVPA